MLIVYATVDGNGAIENTNGKINIAFDKLKLENKIVVMTEEYFFKNAKDFTHMRVIVITTNNLSQQIDVECFTSLEHLIKAQAFANKELYLIGSYKMLKEALEYADKIVMNVSSSNSKQAITYFPTIDDKWSIIKIKEETPQIHRLVYAKDKH